MPGPSDLALNSHFEKTKNRALIPNYETQFACRWSTSGWYPCGHLTINPYLLWCKLAAVSRHCSWRRRLSTDAFHFFHHNLPACVDRLRDCIRAMIIRRNHRQTHANDAATFYQFASDGNVQAVDVSSLDFFASFKGCL